MKAIIWHNPRCSKSRAALALLEAAGVEVEIYDYRGHPPSPERLAATLARAGLTPRAVLRAGEPGAMALAGADDAALLAAMAADPTLIERPIVETARGTVLARPPERIHELL